MTKKQTPRAHDYGLIPLCLCPPREDDKIRRRTPAYIVEKKTIPRATKKSKRNQNGIKPRTFLFWSVKYWPKKKKKDFRWAQIFQDSEEFSRENPVGKTCTISASRSRTGWFWLEEELLGIWRKGAQLLWVEVWALDWCSFLLAISALTLSRRGRTRTSLSSLRLVLSFFFSFLFLDLASLCCCKFCVFCLLRKWSCFC